MKGILLQKNDIINKKRSTAYAGKPIAEIIDNVFLQLTKMDSPILEQSSGKNIKSAGRSHCWKKSLGCFCEIIPAGVLIVN